MLSNYFYHSEDLLLGHPINQTVESIIISSSEENEVALRFSPERPSPRLFIPMITTSPAPDSELNMITSQGGGLNASMEFNVSDEEKFDSSLPPIKWPDSIPLEDFPMLPKINWRPQRYPILPKTPMMAFSSELSMPQPIHRTRSLFQEPSTTKSQFTLPLKGTTPKLKPLGTFDNPIVLDDDEDNLGFSEVKGKYQVIEKIGEGTFSSVYKGISTDGSNSVVALKRIYATCRPARILNEIQHLKNLGGKNNVIPLLGGLRHNDQVTLILPYFEHDKFKDYLFTMNTKQIQQYMYSMFKSLSHLHNNQIIHRDVKPGNFLYNISKNEFLLVDFGLAQLQTEMTPPSPPPLSPNGSPPSAETLENSTKKRFAEEEITETTKKMKCENLNIPISHLSPTSLQSMLQQPHKKAMQAPRAGTRGFRAPEVLLKYPYQTVAIDIWSAGIVFLCMLSMRYPFFNSPDDLSALAEIGAICGTKEVSAMGAQLGRRVHFPVEMPKQDIKHMCHTLSGGKVTVPDSAYNLLSKCLELHPNDRISATDALKHPFFANM